LLDFIVLKISSPFFLSNWNFHLSISINDAKPNYQQLLIVIIEKFILAPVLPLSSTCKDCTSRAGFASHPIWCSLMCCFSVPLALD